jgi:hypothetical protein
MPVHSFQTLLKDLATLVKSQIIPRGVQDAAFCKITTPTPLQRRAFELLGLPSPT